MYLITKYFSWTIFWASDQQHPFREIFLSISGSPTFDLRTLLPLLKFFEDPKVGYTCAEIGSRRKRSWIWFRRIRSGIRKLCREPCCSVYKVYIKCPANSWASRGQINESCYHWLSSWHSNRAMKNAWDSDTQWVTEVRDGLVLRNRSWASPRWWRENDHHEHQWTWHSLSRQPWPPGVFPAKEREDKEG